MIQKRKIKIIPIIGAYPDIGKGLLTSSIAYLLKEAGITVSPLKFDGYLNYNSGSMNAYHANMEHLYNEEEVFVLKDGFEGDADSGSYERFLMEEYDQKSNLTNGQLFKNLLQAEKKGKFPTGEVLKFLHIRKEIEKWLIENATQKEIVILEIGGTIGDPESKMVYETLSSLKESCQIQIFPIMLSPYFSSGSKTTNFELSFRSKLTRMANDLSWRLGLKPKMIILRTGKKEKILSQDLNYIASDCALPKKLILKDPECNCLYELPGKLHRQNILEPILGHFSLKTKKNHQTKRLEKYLQRREKIQATPQNNIQVAVFGKTPSFDSYISLKEAIQHSCTEIGQFPQITWLDGLSKRERKMITNKIDCLIVAEGLKYLSEKKRTLRKAREDKIPTLAIAFGADLAIIEYLQSKGHKVTHPEIETIRKSHFFKKTKKIIVGSYRLKQIRKIHKKRFSSDNLERFRTYTLPSEKTFQLLKKEGFTPQLVSQKLGPVAWQLSMHPFYVAARFKPEFKSYPGKAHPLFNQLITQALAEKRGGEHEKKTKTQT
jgi:CTP synthase